MLTTTAITRTIFLLSLLNALINGRFEGHKDPNTHFVHEKIITPITVLNISDMPTNFDWGNVNGTNYLTVTKNQHIPQYCGSCWAQSATSAMSDRIKIVRKSAWPDFNLAPQVLISCFDICQGCHGGLPVLAYEYLTTNYITDETCSPYQAWGHDDGLPCSDQLICQNDDYYYYQVKEYGYVHGEQAMMSEIYQRGPITCGVTVPESLENYTGGILYDHSNVTEITHDISVVGFGEENGTKFWRVRNSWGTPWGEEGYFRVIRGVNNLQIESNCSWAVMMDTWTHDQKRSRNGSVQEGKESKVSVSENYVSQYPQSGSVPGAWDWRNVNGVNYLSWNKNQRAPNFCNCSWAQAATSSLADRFNILQNNSFPQVGLSVQMVINCNGGGNCSGGDSLGVYQLAYSQGLPDFSCQVYYGEDAQILPVCSAKDVCYTCDWPPSPMRLGIGAGKCSSITEFKKYYVSQYGQVSGVEEIKKEIYQRGPVSCKIEATKTFLNWTGFVQQGMEMKMDKIIGLEGILQVCSYEVSKHFLKGTFWGYYDFFRIKMESDNLGITKECSYGVPSFTSNSAYD